MSRRYVVLSALPCSSHPVPNLFFPALAHIPMPLSLLSYHFEPPHFFYFFFFNDTATTEIYTLSLHDALPITARGRARGIRSPDEGCGTARETVEGKIRGTRPRTRRGKSDVEESRDGTGARRSQGEGHRLPRHGEIGERTRLRHRGGAGGPRDGRERERQRQVRGTGASSAQSPRAGIAGTEGPPRGSRDRDPAAGRRTPSSPRRGPTDASPDRETPLITGGPSAGRARFPGTSRASRTRAGTRTPCRTGARRSTSSTSDTR